MGGTVKYDLYAAGTTGSVKDGWGVKNGFTVGNTDYDGFVASTTAYIEGGTARNVYGGGWKGSVGQHNGAITESYAGDILGETHVIIGILKDHLPSNPKTSTDAGYDPDYSSIMEFLSLSGMPTVAVRVVLYLVMPISR